MNRLEIKITEEQIILFPFLQSWNPPLDIYFYEFPSYETKH